MFRIRNSTDRGHADHGWLKSRHTFSFSSYRTHSEFNPSATEPVHLYQIWLYPERKGLMPGYEQKRFSPEDRLNRFQLVASPEPNSGSLMIHQDARILLGDIRASQALSYGISADRHVWLQVLRGEIAVNGVHLHSGDGLAVSDERSLTLEGVADSELMLFDLA